MRKIKNKKRKFAKAETFQLSSPFSPSLHWKTIPIEDQYTLLAQLKEVCFLDNGKKRIKKFENDRWELLWNPVEKCLIGIRKKLIKKVKEKREILTEQFSTNESFQMVKIFKDYDFKNCFYADLKMPLEFVKLGKGIHVVYKSNKWNPKTYYEYIHEFGEDGRTVEKNHGVNVYYDRQNKLIKMCGGKLTVNERGIIH